MKLSRRSWIKLTAGAAGMVTAAGGTAWFFRSEIKKLHPSEATVLLRRNFDYLKLEITDDVFDTFVRLYEEHYGAIIRKGWYRLRGRSTAPFQSQLDHLAGTFLMSTDFFLNGADEAKPVRYVAFYHPYAAPCWNPLSLRAHQPPAEDVKPQPAASMAS